MVLDQYRVDHIEKTTINGLSVKLFRAFRINDVENVYTYVGLFSAPGRTPDKDLVKHILIDVEEQEQHPSGPKQSNRATR